MITEQDLREAIAECQGIRNPTANTCIKLAAFYIILDHIGKDEEEPSYSLAPAPSALPSGDSEFEQRAGGRDIAEIWPEIVSLVEAVQVTNPRLYDSFILRL